MTRDPAGLFEVHNLTTRGPSRCGTYPTLAEAEAAAVAWARVWRGHRFAVRHPNGEIQSWKS